MIAPKKTITFGEAFPDAKTGRAKRDARTTKIRDKERKLKIKTDEAKKKETTAQIRRKAIDKAATILNINRQPGSMKAERVAEAVMMDVELPHLWLLRVMQGEEFDVFVPGKRSAKGTTVKIRPTFEQRMEAAKAAAPYFAPRLGSIEVMRGLTDGDLDQLIIGLVQETGLGPLSGGAFTAQSRKPEDGYVPGSNGHARDKGGRVLAGTSTRS